VTVDHGPTFHDADVRYAATGGLNALTKSWLRISMNPAHGDGGTCYGDSGGPNFLGAGAAETNVVAATTVTGDTRCRATNVDYRMDTPPPGPSSAGSSPCRSRASAPRHRVTTVKPPGTTGASTVPDAAVAVATSRPDWS